MLLSSWFFPIGSAKALGLYRFFFYSIIFFVFADNQYLISWHNVPIEMWSAIGLTNLLEQVLISYPADFVFKVWQCSLVFAAFGFMTRSASILAFITGFLLIGYAQSFGYYTRLFMPILWSLFFMSFAKSGESYSIDQWLKKNNHPTDSVEYGWPLQILRIVFCVVYFQAGISKLINGGLEWFDGISLQNYMIASYVWPFNSADRLDFSFHKFIFESINLLKLGVWFSFLVEILCPIALFSKKLRAPFVFGLAIMQIVARFTIFVNFSGYIALYLVWMPWGYISQRFGRK